MRKRKLIIGSLVFLIIILCMMTFYMQRQYNHMQIAYNRVDREYQMLNADYEKLYTAYYSYDKKVLEILKFSDKVYWAEDSSAYVINNCFSFYKKPRMDNPYFIWWYHPNKLFMHNNDTSEFYNYEMQARIDTLKPHQFYCIVPSFDFRYGIVVAPVSLSNPDLPDSSKTVSVIIFEKSSH